MTLGTGIFLAAIVMSLTALFIATKDRWNWKKILLWPLGICVASGVAMWGYIEYENRAYKALAIEKAVQSSFWDIPLGATRDDVVFKKGKSTNQDPDSWLYTDGVARYLIAFQENRVRMIAQFGDSHYPQINRVGVASATAAVTAAFGEPEYVSSSDEGAERTYCYPAYQVLFRLRKDAVTSLGVYDRASPPAVCEPPAKDGAATK
jgi:hypothetical protein